MSGFFTLWDIESGNFVEEFTESSAALRAAAELIELNKPAYPDALLLRWTGPDGEPHDIAIGPTLVALTDGFHRERQAMPAIVAARRSRRVPLRHRRHMIREVVREPLAS